MVSEFVLTDAVCFKGLLFSRRVTLLPTDVPWKVREMHLRHSDGHVFRVVRGFEPEE
jgi:hypothetical protein